MSLPIIDICCEGIKLSKLSLDFSRHVKNRDINEENIIKAITMMHVDSYKLLKKCLKDEPYFEPAGIKYAMSKLYKLLDQYKADC